MISKEVVALQEIPRKYVRELSLPGPSFEEYPTELGEWKFRYGT